MGKVILLTDIYKLREEKERELRFYRDKLDELERKLFFLNKEVQLTNFIIDLIEKEKVTDLSDFFKSK